jgi:hypothetical protein
MRNVFGWIALGFAAGAAATLAAVTLVQQQPLSGPPQRDSATAAPEAAPDGPAPLLNADPLGELDVDQRVAMMRWMAAHPSFEFVMRDYCGCLDIPEPACPGPDDVSRQGDYPYGEVYDYNGDGHRDFAVMLGLKGKEGPQVLFIFNGPFGDSMPAPTYRAEGWRRRDQIHGGFVGPLESDDGYFIKAAGAAYELDYIGDPE